LKQREKHEDKNAGGYTRIYPPRDDPALLEYYNKLLDGSQKAFQVIKGTLRKTRKH
jgi:hypothetical protein